MLSLLRLAFAFPLLAAADGAAAEATSQDALVRQHFAERALRAIKRQNAMAALADTRSTNAEVKRFAADMLLDYRLLEPWLGALARPEPRDEETIPQISAAQIPYRRVEYNRLRVLSGAAFDRQFLAEAVVAYEKMIRRFEAAAREDEGLGRRIAEATLPQLNERLARARALLADIEAAPARAPQ